jgi:glycosyltransferase involved in cell wall biosynthesis
MNMNILLLIAHSIEEYDQVKLLSELGYDVFSIGGYIDPANPHDPKRPPLLTVPYHADLHWAVDAMPAPDGNHMEAAKRRLPEPLLEWANVVIVHHYEHLYLGGQWARLRRFIREGGRVIWRTVGQSATPNELAMVQFCSEGLEIVRYSPKERNIPSYAGENALIRFYKDPREWCGWEGDDNRVINVTADLAQRGDATNWRFWEAATQGLPRLPLGRGSEVIGGPGEMPLDQMQTWLRRARAYLYTGTQPASYTLGLLEAMMTGIPVVSIGPQWYRSLPYGSLLFEGHELTSLYADDPALCREHLRELLQDHEKAALVSRRQRETAVQLFGRDKIAAEWKAYLG